MIDFLLLDLPDNLTIFLFLLFGVNFYILKDVTPFKVFKLIVTAVFIYFINTRRVIQDDIITLALNPLPIAALWMVFFEKVSIKKFAQIYSGIFLVILFKLIAQFYIPIIPILFNVDYEVFQSMLDNPYKAFILVLPARIIEFVMIYLIYKHQKNKFSVYNIVSKGVTTIAEKSSNTATLWWVHQPREPKSIKKVM